MATTIEEAQAEIGQTQAMANHDHDLIHELSKRIDAVWRYDQYIANADGRPELQEFWREVKAQDKKNADRLKTLIANEIEKACF